MQDMAASYCAATDEGEETQLEDSRDGNKYWIGKMKDGQCWMLQNLALGNSSGATALTSADSNVASDWSLPKSYATAASGSTATTAIQSWNLGKWVLATPLLTTSCGASGISSLASCIKVGFVDVSSSNFSAGYTATTGTWNGANANSSTLIAVNCTSWSGSGTSKTCTAGTYDAHYLVGNHYSWNAATAKTGVGMTSGQASGSICPKGWRLPSRGTSSTTTNELYQLTNAYGVSSSLSGTGADSKSYNIADSPLSFVRSGLISTPSGSILGIGQQGDCWSSTPMSSSESAYILQFTDAIVDPSHGQNRRNGLPVRCIAE